VAGVNGSQMHNALMTGVPKASLRPTFNSLQVFILLFLAAFEVPHLRRLIFPFPVMASINFLFVPTLFFKA
jgi:hypothetical protein